MNSNQAAKIKASIPESSDCEGDRASSRQRWTRPALQRLAASAAELGGGTHADAEGFS